MGPRPNAVASPATVQPRSLNRIGTPRKGPSGRSPAASTRAWSNRVRMTASSFAFTVSMRPIAASTSSAALTSPRRTSSACAVASSHVVSLIRHAALRVVRARFIRHGTPPWRHSPSDNKRDPLLLAALRARILASVCATLTVPTLANGPFRLRPFGVGDLDLIREASDDPYIPVITTVPSVFSEDEGRRFVERQWSRAADGAGYS